MLLVIKPRSRQKSIKLAKIEKVTEKTERRQINNNGMNFNEQFSFRSVASPCRDEIFTIFAALYLENFPGKSLMVFTYSSDGKLSVFFIGPSFPIRRIFLMCVAMA